MMGFKQRDSFDATAGAEVAPQGAVLAKFNERRVSARLVETICVGLLRYLGASCWRPCAPASLRGVLPPWILRPSIGAAS